MGETRDTAFGAARPEGRVRPIFSAAIWPGRRKKGAGLVLPSCNSEAHGASSGGNLACGRAPGRGHAILLLDQAGIGMSRRGFPIPDNITLLAVAAEIARASIRSRNIWQFMRDNWLSNRVFKSYDDILDHCCFAWNNYKLIDMPWKIMSIRDQRLGLPVHDHQGLGITAVILAIPASLLAFCFQLRLSRIIAARCLGKRLSVPDPRYRPSGKARKKVDTFHARGTA